MRALVGLFPVLIAAAQAQTYRVGPVAGASVAAGAAALELGLGSPVRLAFGASGNLYTSCGNRRQVCVVNPAGTVIRVIGSGAGGYSGEGGAASDARLMGVRSLALDSSGNLFIADGMRVRKVDGATGIITTIAGTGYFAYNGDNIPATAANLEPASLAVDTAGNLYIGDAINHRVRRVAAGTGLITTIAGTGAAGYNGDNIAATAATLNYPYHIAFDAAGNLYLWDSLNYRIRKISAGTGQITTLAGNGSPFGSGADNVPAVGTPLSAGSEIGVDSSGNVYFGEGARVRKISAATGILTTVAGTGASGYGADNVPATSSALWVIGGVLPDAAGNLYISDGDRIRKVAAGTGIITTVAGNGSGGYNGDHIAAVSATLASPNGVALDADGNVYIADSGNHRVRRVDAATGIISTAVGNGFAVYNGENLPAIGAGIKQPTTLVFDSAGNLYICETGRPGQRVRRVSAAGVITTVAGTGEEGFNGDNQPATLASISPMSITLDNSGNLYIAESARIRKVTAATGLISTIAGNGSIGYNGDGIAATAATLNYPQSLAVDAAGNVYIADTWNHRVRKVNAVTGIISTVAGNGTSVPMDTPDGSAATGVPVTAPMGLTFDGAGNLYVADGSNRIRRVSAVSGSIDALSGNFGVGSSGDGGLALAAEMRPAALAFDRSGRLFFADPWNDRVRVLTPNPMVTIASNPPGVSVTIDGVPTPTPATVSWLPGSLHSLSVPATITHQSAGYTFANWSQGGARTQSITAPSSDTTYTANYLENCVYVIDIGAMPLAAGGAAGSFAVSAPSHCAWTAASDAPWLAVAPGTRHGSGSASYVAASNPGSGVRSGGLTIAGQSFMVTQQGFGVSVALRFVPVTPCRVADTRNSAGAFGGPQLPMGGAREFPIAASACGIPATARAYSLNVAVVPAGPLGYLTVWPTGQPRPLVSTVNSLDGRVKSNAAIVPAGSDGAISVFASNATHLVLDINGYFVPATDPDALAFFPLPPCRVVDTRTAAAALAGPSLAGGSTRSFPVRAATGCNIPSTAQAYSLNLAAVPKGPLGYLTAWAGGQAQPLVATLNAPTGTITANAAIVSAAGDGSIQVFASNATDLIVDINGYFAPPGAGGLSFYATTPCRSLDSRSPSGSPAFSGTIAVSGACGVASAQAYVFGATVVPSGAFGYLTMWPQGSTRPLVAALNATDGMVTSNLAVVPAASGAISAFASNPTHLILDLFGYFAP